MKESLTGALYLVLAQEGGYSDHPRDPGGPTMRGITISTLAAWRGRPVTVTDLKAIDANEIAAIYKGQYADKVLFSRLPRGVDYAVLDCAVHCGPARAAKLLQDVAGVEMDGIVGAKTLQAVQALAVYDVVDRLSRARLDFLRTLVTWGTFGTGWSKRVAAVRKAALDMAMGLEPMPSAADGVVCAKGAGAVKLTATSSGRTALATVGSLVAAAGAAAGQATEVLTPYADVRYVRYALLGLALVSAVATLTVAMQRARKGATS